MSGHAMVSVHDLMPSTMRPVLKILAYLEEARIPPPTLLVVPGKDWSRQEIGTLRALAENGHSLAGHGWVHQASPGRRSLYHRGHGLLISRNEAEHLSRPTEDLTELVLNSFRWFGRVGLPDPLLYVPPAWALGRLPKKELQLLPFKWVEVLHGLMDTWTGRTRWLPLAGFEADTTFRKVGLRVWNAGNAVLANRAGIPLRIAIHPGDLELLLRDDLKRLLNSGWRFVDEEEVMGSTVTRDPP